jgi:nitrite reductase/ring-hydroxylating ferredoxin subunit
LLPKLGKPGPAFLADVPGAPEAGTVLCRIDEIPENGAKVFTFGTKENPFEFFVQRLGDAVLAYRNLCPHIALPLDWRPGLFMDPQRKFFLCANHGAVFRPEDGFCFAGPCRGQSLTAIAIEVKDGAVIVG